MICVGDNLDTADENWEITMGAAALRHGLHIPDTRRRVRRTATHSFHKGGMVQKIRYGYRRLTAEEAASGQFGPKGLRIARRPECTPIIREMMDRVMRGDPYAAVADWLEAEGIEPGPYVEGRRWTARLVVELLDDPILSGMRTFRDTICRPIFSTGKHKPVRERGAGDGALPGTCALSVGGAYCPSPGDCPATGPAHTPTSQDRRSGDGIPRSRTFWPGQAAVCGACGGPMYYSGKHLRCRNSLPRYGGSCWNHVQVPADMARRADLQLAGRVPGPQPRSATGHGRISCGRNWTVRVAGPHAIGPISAGRSPPWSGRRPISRRPSPRAASSRPCWKDSVASKSPWKKPAPPKQRNRRMPRTPSPPFQSSRSSSRWPRHSLG